MSMTIRIPDWSDSSLMFDIPSIFFSFTIEAMSLISSSLFTLYGIAVTTILSCVPDSISATARIMTRPRPVSYASRTPFRPKISHPVGKSGAFTYSIRPSVSISGLSIYATHASSTSLRLCVGIFVAIPTAIPDEPFTKRLGIRVGITVGSTNSSL